MIFRRVVSILTYIVRLYQVLSSTIIECYPKPLLSTGLQIYKRNLCSLDLSKVQESNLHLASSPSPANYNKESLTEAFVKFLEKESAPRPPGTAGGGLLNIMAHPSHSQQSAPTTASRTATPTPQQAPTVDQNQNPASATAQAATASAPAPVPVKPIVLGEFLKQSTTTFQAPRSSSSILKDILSDS